MVTVKGVALDFDADDFAEACGLERIRPMGEWVMSACPFHKHGSEKHASFGINRDSGIYNCFTCHVSGTVLKLATELMFGGTDEAAAAKWLVKSYAVPELESRKQITVRWPEDHTAGEYLPEEALEPFAYRTQYVYKRGLTEAVAQFFDLGYNRDKDALTIPWRDAQGRLVFIKERPLGSGPKFSNDKGSHKGLYLFGLWLVKSNAERRVFVVESEICCMWLWQHNIPAVALGGSWAMDEQIKELLRAPSVEEVVFMLDQDEAGHSGTARLISILRGKRRLYRAIYPRLTAKDPNDLLTEELPLIRLESIL